MNDITSDLQATYNDLLALQDQTDQVPLTVALDAVGAALHATQPGARCSPATATLLELSQQLLDAAHYSTELTRLEGHCRDIARKLEDLAEAQPSHWSAGSDEPGKLYDREEHIAQLQSEAGFYQCLYESAIKRFEQIAIVCTDNMDRDCDHRMALDFVRQIANDRLELSRHDAQPSLTVEDVYANCETTLIGFREELTERDIKFICDQVSRKVMLAMTSPVRGGE